MSFDLAHLKTLAQAATPGPWRSSWDDPRDEVTGERPWLIKSATLNANALLGDDVVCLVYWDGDNLGCTEPDAAFIAACDPTTTLGLLAEIERCHTRLEIDREYEPVGETLVERSIPYADRVGTIDGIACRDATISALEERIKEQRAEIERLRLRSHRDVYKAGFDAGIAAAISSTNDDNDTNRERIQVQAAIESRRLDAEAEGADEIANGAPA